MPRLALLPDLPPQPRTQLLFERVRTAMGPEFHMPDLYRVLGHAPELFEAWIAFAWPLRQKAKTSRKLRELMILRGAQITRTPYEWAHHLPMALAAGVSHSQIDALANWRTDPGFSAQERAVLQLADEVTQGPGASAPTLAGLKEQGFDDEAVVELTLTASFYVCVGRLIHSLGIEPEEGYRQHVDRM